ncbi:MAG TPA: chemotaxis protein CheB [Solirubrobacteraceae bacterium]|nr:chemotaxis protein CheB [Solirubrobacteraceae bacterium]
MVVGASAGGVEALISLAGSLSPDIDAAILVVLHISATGTSVLPSILDRVSRLHVESAVSGAPLLPGTVYVAPPDHHMLVEDGTIVLTQAPRENGHRPAIDPAMRSAAAAYGPAAIGVVLSGARDDGTAGLLAIKAAGGKAVVQDPQEAVYASMPRSAIEHAQVDAVLPVAGIAAWLGEAPPPPDGHGGSVAAMVHNEQGATGTGTPPGEGTRYTCPDCGGVLFADEEGSLLRFRCSVGHAFSPESLESAQAAALESALWAAVRSLEDRADLLERMAKRHGTDRHRAERLRQEARVALERAETIRGTIEEPHDLRRREPAA